MMSILERAKQAMQPVAPRPNEARPTEMDVPAAADRPAATPTLDVETILSMPLSEFGARHLAARIQLPDGTQCWFVSGAAEVAVLRGEGVDRGLIWTARELADVLGAGWSRETIGRLIACKREFDGSVAPSAPRPTTETRP